MRKTLAIALCALAGLAMLSSPAEAVLRAIMGPKGEDAGDKRNTVRQQQGDILALFYESNPELKDKVRRAVGYATFSVMDLNLFLLATGGGYGMAVDNRADRSTFMRVASIGGGVGLGAKDLRILFIFNDAAVMRQFVEQGWQFGGGADASAKVNEKGVGSGAAASINIDPATGTAAAGGTVELSADLGEDARGRSKAATPGGMEIYQHTKSGVALQATVSGTKYWKDAELNQ